HSSNSFRCSVPEISSRRRFCAPGRTLTAKARAVRSSNRSSPVHETEHARVRNRTPRRRAAHRSGGSSLPGTNGPSGRAGPVRPLGAVGQGGGRDVGGTGDLASLGAGGCRRTRHRTAGRGHSEPTGALSTALGALKLAVVAENPVVVAAGRAR